MSLVFYYFYTFLFCGDISKYHPISLSEHPGILMVVEGLDGQFTLHCTAESSRAIPAWSSVLTGLYFLQNATYLIKI